MSTHVRYQSSICSIGAQAHFPLFSRVKFLGWPGLIALHLRKLLLQAYEITVVTVFLNRAFLLFSAPGTENCGNQIYGGQGPLSPGFCESHIDITSREAIFIAGFVCPTPTLTNGDLCWIWRNSTSSFVTFTSKWRVSELSGNRSNMAPCAWGWISKMPSSMSPWVPRSRNSLGLNRSGNHMNGRFYYLVSNVYLEYWLTWWLPLLNFIPADASAWWPIWTILQTKQDAGVRWSTRSMW